MSLKALRIRSTSISRWNAVASRFNSLSISSAEGWLGLEELAEGFGVDDEASDMALQLRGDFLKYLKSI